MAAEIAIVRGEASPFRGSDGGPAGVACQTTQTTGAVREPVIVPDKPMHKGVFYGGFLFGVGWFITGTCPGPVYAQLGGGEFFAVFTLIGALAGVYAFAAVKPRLPD